MRMSVILVGRDDDIVALTQFITHKEDKVEVVADPAQVGRFAQFRREQGQAYDLAIIDGPSVGGDPLEYISALRRTDPHLAIALLVPFMESQSIKPKADQLGVAMVFAKPVDLSAVQQFLQRQSFLNTTAFGSRKITTSMTRRGLRTISGLRETSGIPTPSSGGQVQTNQSGPFFGASRTGSGDGTGTQTRLPAPGTESGYKRQRSGLIDLSSGNGSTRIRRSVTQPPTTAPPLHSTPDQRPTETMAAAQPFVARDKKVRCAHCQQVFQVTTKAVPFTMPCIHCGGLNRIMP